jgi:CheY-like chemotaxis protein
MEAIGTLAGGIAHDFNNILGAILGYAQLAELDLPENHRSREFIKQILSASERAKSLVGQILAFSRQSKLEKIPMDIGVVVKEVLKLLRASLPANIEIRQTINKRFCTVMADQTQIHQVMMNLGTNALHAMEQNGGLLEVVLDQIEFNVEDVAAYHDLKAGKYLKLSVTDTGKGMDAATLARIFEPYFTTKDVGEGTGLGLSTVHGIIENHGGTIQVQSEPGVGTSFDLFFPCLEIEADREAKVSKQLVAGTERILFVDDEKVLIDIGEKMLTKLGYKVDCRTSPYEALETFKRRPEKYDLVITDMSMPKMTGDRLAEEIIKIRPDMPIIICTGFSNMINLEKAPQKGIRDCLMKPIAIDELSKSIRSVLD